MKNLPFTTVRSIDLDDMERHLNEALSRATKAVRNAELTLFDARLAEEHAREAYEAYRRMGEDVPIDPHEHKTWEAR